MSEKSRFIVRRGLRWGTAFFVVMALVNAFTLEDLTYVLTVRYLIANMIGGAVAGLLYGWWEWGISRSHRQTEARSGERVTE